MELWSYGEWGHVARVTMEHCVASVMLISPRCRLVRVSCLLTPLPLHRGEKNGAYTYFDILYLGIMEFDVKQIHRQINMTLTLNIQIV